MTRDARTRVAFEQTQQRRDHAVLQEGRLGVLALEVVVLENVIDRLAQLGADERQLNDAEIRPEFPNMVITGDVLDCLGKVLGSTRSGCGTIARQCPR